MFRYSASREGDFFIYATRTIDDAMKIWSSPTTRTLLGLAARVETKLIKKGDEISRAIAEAFLEASTNDSDDPEDSGITREKGEGHGEGIPCRYGVGCRRRDCWFMHPKLEIPTEDIDRKVYDIISSEYIVDHCIRMANGKENLIKLIDYYTLKMNSPVDLKGTLINPRNRNVSAPVAENYIHAEAKKGNAMAQYIWGKMLGDSSFKCLGKDGAQRHMMIKFWTSSALAGNAFAQMGLAKVHDEDGHLPVNIHWCKRALSSAALPEAAYYLAVAYSKVARDHPDYVVPVQYELGAKYYGFALQPQLPKLNPLDSSFDPDDMDDSLMFSVMILGPYNTLQQEYQKLSINNIRVMEYYIGHPELAPVPNSIAASPIKSTETCALCGRRPNTGEKGLATCNSCHKVKYCNNICQRGHWSVGHKKDCQA